MMDYPGLPLPRRPREPSRLAARLRRAAAGPMFPRSINRNVGRAYFVCAQLAAIALGLAFMAMTRGVAIPPAVVIYLVIVTSASLTAAILAMFDAAD